MRIFKSVLIIALYCVVIIGVLEVSLRLWFNVSPFVIVNFRTEHKVDDAFSGFVAYDEILGWTQNANLDSGAMGTLDHGIRRNSDTQTDLQKGGWLVSGSSFTAGSGVDDANTWPALLQQLEDDKPVHNAAVGGYALDQVVLRAEALLDVLEPEILLIDLMQTTISWTGYSVLTQPKPYFVIDNNGILKRPQKTIPRIDNKPAPISGFWHYAAYSYLVDRVMASIDGDSWYASARENVVIAPGNSNPVALSCALLDRVAKKATDHNTRLVIVSIPTGQEIEISEEPASVVGFVEECAANMGIQIVPVRQRMHEDIKKGTIKPSDIYQMADNRAVGHMTGRGNTYVAQVVHETLKQPFTPQPKTVVQQSFDNENVKPENLLTDSENLNALFNPNQVAKLSFEETNEAGNKVFRFESLDALSAGKPTLSSHYFETGAGFHVISMDVKPIDLQKFTLFISTNKNESLTAGFDFANNNSYILPSHVSIGRDWKSRVEKKQDGWFRIWVGLYMPKSRISFSPGLGDEHGVMTQSAGQKPGVLLRHIQYEAGREPTSYKPTKPSSGLEGVAGDGVNLISDAENFHEIPQQNEILSISKDDGFNFFSPTAFLLTPTGGETEHYVRFDQAVSENNVYVLSFEMKRKFSTPLRVQMIDGTRNGAYADFDLSTGSTSTGALGDNKNHYAAMSRARKGWHTVSLAVHASDPKLTVTLQTLNVQGKAQFKPGEEKILFRDVRLEKGVRRAD